MIIWEIFPIQGRGIKASIATFALMSGNFFVSSFSWCWWKISAPPTRSFIFVSIAVLALLFVLAMVA